MRIRLIAALGAAALLLTSSVAAGEAEARPGTSDVIVVLRDEADPNVVADEHRRGHGAEVSHVYGSALRGYAARVPTGRLGALRRDPRVAFVNEDRPVQAFDRHAGELPYGVERIDGHQSSRATNTTDLTAPGVAILDTGIASHPDLNIRGGTSCQGGTFGDVNGHGTHVAGTVGARRNGSGVVGVLPGAALYAVKVLNDQGSGTWSSIICGIDWVTANAAVIKVANMSLGGSGRDDGLSCSATTDSLKRALCRSVAAGVTYIVAAGNSGADLAGFVPAAYPQVMAVTALADFDGRSGGLAEPTCREEDDDTPASFSNYATTTADRSRTIAAPGVCIRSTWPGGGYNTISGTSMASPHVAGVAALCIASTRTTGTCANMTPSQIVQKLRTDAAARPPSYGFSGDAHTSTNPYYGHLVWAGGY